MMDPFASKNIKILSVDFEKRQITEKRNNTITRNQIFAAGFCSNIGLIEAIHLEDSRFNNDEVKFIRCIVYKIQSFQGIIPGWYLASSDLIVLDEVCKHVGVVSSVKFYEVSVTNPREQVDDNEDDNNDDNYDATRLSDTIHNSKASKKKTANDNDRKAKNIQRNEYLINIDHYLKDF
jgi:hypothetical protein